MLAFILSDGCSEAVRLAGSGCGAGLWRVEDEEGLTRSPMARGYLAKSSWHISSQEAGEESLMMEARAKRKTILSTVDPGVVEDVKRPAATRVQPQLWRLNY